MQLDGFQLSKLLGEGFSAQVRLAETEDGQRYAIKIFDLDKPDFNERAFRLLKEEVKATTQLDHPNIVKYHDFKE